MLNQRLLKRVFDVAATSAAAPVVLPVGTAAAALVRVTSPGPALFRHRRVGRGGKPFDVLKLRTMRPSTNGPAITAGGDPRITPIGRLLRKTKLDELPQLINVLNGDMSLVGPRPEAPGYVDVDDPRWQRVLSVRPGITDLASLTFRYEEELLARALNRERAYREVILPLKLELAIQGIERSSFCYDLGILLRTALAVARPGPADSATIETARRRVEDLNRSHEPLAGSTPHGAAA